MEKIVHDNFAFYNFLNDYFQKDYQLIPLTGDGSNRKFFRVFSQKKSFILTSSSNIKENKSFLYLSYALKKRGIAVPEIYKVDSSKKFYLQEDLGEKNLAEYIMSNPLSKKKIIDSYCKIIDDVANLHKQVKVLQECSIKQKFSNLLEEHLSYFKAHFLAFFDKEKKYYPVIIREGSLLVKKIKELSQQQKQGIITRDLQARNIFYYKKKYYFIDYQDICEGSIFYDLASLLFASSSYLENNTRKELINYLQKNYFTKEEDKALFFYFVLLRRLRSLGTYTKLGILKGKKNFQNHFQKTFKELIFIHKNYNIYQIFPQIMKMLTDFSQNNFLK